MNHVVSKILIFFVFCGISTATNTTGSTPQEPRFCSLPLNATSFAQCDWVSYSKTVITRSIPGLAIAAFFLVTLIIILFTLCCLRCRHPRKGQTKCLSSPFARFGLMTVPLTLFTIGGILVILAHFQVNPAFEYSVTYLGLQSDNIDKLSKEVNVTMSEVKALFPNTPISVSQIGGELPQIESSLIMAHSISVDVQTARLALLIVAVSFAFLTGLLGLVFFCSVHGCFFFSNLFLAFILIVGSCIFIGVLAVMQPVFEDTCYEVDYQGGVFDLLQSQFTTVYNQVQSSIDSQTNSSILQICGNFQNLCKNYKELCGKCDTSTFPNFMNSTVTDQDGTKKTLQKCASTCVSSGLKNLATNYVNEVTLDNILANFLIDVHNTTNFFTKPVKDQMRVFLCNTENPICFLYAGCALFLTGCALSGFFMLLITRVKMGEFEREDHESLYQLSTTG